MVFLSSGGDGERRSYHANLLELPLFKDPGSHPMFSVASAGGQLWR